MKFSNLHAHTTYSDGRDSVEEMVKAAIDCGFVSVGISDHSYTACDESYCMKKDALPQYLAEVRQVAEKYKGQIDVFAGLELDYYSDLDTSMLDYVIGSVHYVKADGIYHAIDHAANIQQACIDTSFGGDPYAMTRQYFEELTDHILKHRPQVVGHFDVVSKFSLYDENDPRYRKQGLEALDAILSTDAIVEINTGGMARGLKTTPYPYEAFLRYILEKKGRITWGADCHKTENTDFKFREMVPYLKEIGFRSMAILTKEGFTDVEF